tara:strand:- start:873 stop:1481 length:609 start_codon:yes stop_codon:yes gene_type:complete
MIATVTQNSTELNEGGTVSFSVSTSGVADYTNLYFTTEDEIDGTVREEDFTDNSLSGQFQIYNNIGSINRTVSRDRITEGTERFLIKIRETSTTGPIVGISTLIRINDTSRAPSIRANGKTYGPIQVNADNGIIADKSDWYTICDIDSLPEGSKVALLMPNTTTTQASYDDFIVKLTARNITVITVTDYSTDWIQPFLGVLN